MTVSPKRNTVLIQLLYQFEACLALGFNMLPEFLTRCCNLANSDATLFLQPGCTAEKESRIRCYNLSSVLGFDRYTSSFGAVPREGHTE